MTTGSFLDRQRLIGDQSADKVVEQMFSEKKHAELYGALEVSNTSKSLASEFMHSAKTNPDWFNEDRIIRGQQLFESYATEIMMLLGVMALPYCYAASPGNKALFLSMKMRQQPHKRLADTAEFIVNVSTKGNLTDKGTGIAYINRTRLIHAIARYHVLNGAWDEKWGVPINQEDMAGTNLAFSYLILVGLNQSGFMLSDRQKEDFIFLWRYIGYHLGIEDELLPASFMEAHRLAHLIKDRNFKKSHEGIVLTSELLDYYRSVLTDSSSGFIDSQVRYYLGSEVAGYLGLKAETVKDHITGVMNSFQEVRNFFGIHKDSYGMMMANHAAMKKKLGLEGRKGN